MINRRRDKIDRSKLSGTRCIPGSRTEEDGESNSGFTRQRRLTFEYAIGLARMTGGEWGID